MRRKVYELNGEFRCDIDEHTTIVAKTLIEMERSLETIDAHIQKRERRVQGNTDWYQVWKHPN